MVHPTFSRSTVFFPYYVITVCYAYCALSYLIKWTLSLSMECKLPIIFFVLKNKFVRCFVAYQHYPLPYARNPPISPTIRTFDLTLRTSFDFYSLNFILNCMPNLRRFIVTISCLSSMLFQWSTLFDGYRWQESLTRNTPNLDIFEILLRVEDLRPLVNIDSILKSFDYFKNKYNDWHVGIHRSPLPLNHQSRTREILIHTKLSLCPCIYSLEEQVYLRGFSCAKQVQYFKFRQTQVVLDRQSFSSTMDANFPHNLFYPNVSNLRIYVPLKRIALDTRSPCHLFNDVDCLTIDLDSSAVTVWEYIFGFCKSELRIRSYFVRFFSR